VTDVLQANYLNSKRLAVEYAVLGLPEPQPSHEHNPQPDAPTSNPRSVFPSAFVTEFRTHQYNLSATTNQPIDFLGTLYTDGHTTHNCQQVL
jgi:hypothetical protein